MSGNELDVYVHAGGDPKLVKARPSGRAVFLCSRLAWTPQCAGRVTIALGEAPPRACPRCGMPLFLDQVTLSGGLYVAASLNAYDHLPRHPEAPA